MSNFATISDIATLWRPLTQSEQDRASALLPLVCDTLREEAKRVDQDLDEHAADDPAYASTLKLVTVDIIARILRQATDGEPISQESQAALGYSWSGTYAIPGGGMAQAIMKNDLKRLGLRRAQIKEVSLWR